MSAPPASNTSKNTLAPPPRRDRDTDKQAENMLAAEAKRATDTPESPTNFIPGDRKRPLVITIESPSQASESDSEPESKKYRVGEVLASTITPIVCRATVAKPTGVEVPPSSGKPKTGFDIARDFLHKECGLEDLLKDQEEPTKMVEGDTKSPVDEFAMFFDENYWATPVIGKEQEEGGEDMGNERSEKAEKSASQGEEKGESMGKKRAGR